MGITELYAWLSSHRTIVTGQGLTRLGATQCSFIIILYSVPELKISFFCSKSFFNGLKELPR